MQTSDPTAAAGVSQRELAGGAAPPPTGAGASSPSGSSAPTTGRPARSLAPDLARGLMLVLIAMANVSWFLWGHPGTVGMTPHVPAQSPVDTGLQALMTIMVDHRAMPLYAFLFGYGMVQFHRSRLARGLEPRIVRIMLRRRHWSMLLFGLLHAALLFYGDILGAYAVAALLLIWAFFGRRTRTLIIWTAVLGGVLLLFALAGLAGAMMMLAFPTEQSAAGPAAWGNDVYRDWAYATPFLVGIGLRTLMWATTLIPSVLFAVPVPLLLGWIAARNRLLEEPWRHVRTLRMLAIGGIAVGWLTGLPDALVILGAIPLPEIATWAFSGVNTLGGIACGVGYAAAFALLALRLERRDVSAVTAEAPLGREERRALRAHRAAAHKALSPAERACGEPADPNAPPLAATPPALARVIAAVGQRSLTFYLFQSLVFAPVLASWGLGLGPHLSTTTALALAVAVWLVSLPLAWWLDSRGKRGPAELLLRKMTYGRHDPMSGASRTPTT